MDIHLRSHVKKEITPPFKVLSIKAIKIVWSFLKVGEYNLASDRPPKPNIVSLFIKNTFTASIGTKKSSSSHVLLIKCACKCEHP